MNSRDMRLSPNLQAARPVSLVDGASNRVALAGVTPFLARFAQRRHGAPTPRGETTITETRETSDE